MIGLVICFIFLFYNDYKTSYNTFINHAHRHRCWFGWSSCGGNLEYQEETHLSDLVTT